VIGKSPPRYEPILEPTTRATAGVSDLKLAVVCARQRERASLARH